MKYLTLITLVLFFGTGGYAASDEERIRFRGLMKIGPTYLFSISNEDGSRVAWASVGDVFDGYAIRRFDQQTNTLTVRKDGREIRIPLTGAASVAAGIQPDPREVTRLVRLLEELPLEEEAEETVGLWMAEKEAFVRAIEDASSADAILDVLSQHLSTLAVWRAVGEIRREQLSEEDLVAINNPEWLSAVSQRYQATAAGYFDVLRELKYGEVHKENAAIRSRVEDIASIVLWSGSLPAPEEG